MNPRHKRLLLGRNGLKPEHVEILCANRVGSVHVCCIPTGEDGLLFGSGHKDRYGRDCNLKIFVERHLNFEDQLITFVHELIHIPFITFRLLATESAIDRIARGFVRRHREFTARLFSSRTEPVEVYPPQPCRRSRVPSF